VKHSIYCNNKKKPIFFLIIYTRFIDIFSKLMSDQFLLYRPYDYKIILESDKKELIYSLLYKINTKKLETTKQYLRLGNDT
jgi:hypothetical protein